MIDCPVTDTLAVSRGLCLGTLISWDKKFTEGKGVANTRWEEVKWAASVHCMRRLALHFVRLGHMSTIRPLDIIFSKAAGPHGSSQCAMVGQPRAMDGRASLHVKCVLPGGDVAISRLVELRLIMPISNNKASCLSNDLDMSANPVDRLPRSL